MNEYRAAQQTLSHNDSELMKLVSLRSGVGDKVKRYLSEFNEKVATEIDVALETNKQLIEGERKVTSLTREMEEEKVTHRRRKKTYAAN